MTHEQTKCEHCEIIMGGLYKQSMKNPQRCEKCEDIESKIRNICVCGRTFDNNIRHYKQSGNFCSSCMEEVNKKLRNKSFHI